MEYKFRVLKASEIQCRVDELYKTDKYSGARILLYKNARVDMDILDETVGSENWQRDHKEVKGNLYCGVAIWDDDKKCWVTKWDCGTESNTEKEKGEASDSFKRACVNWGIGRELYTAPSIFIKCEVVEINGKKSLADRYLKWRVSEIEYDDNRNIVKLTIVDNNGEIAFQMGLAKSGNAAKTTHSQPTVKTSPFQELKKFAVERQIGLTAICEYAMRKFGAEKLNDLKDNEVRELKEDFISGNVNED